MGTSGPFIVCLFRLATLALRLGVSSRVLAALRSLSVGLIALLGLRGLFIQYDVTDAGPASHRVRLWQGGPASILTSCSGTLWYAVVRRGTQFTGTGFPRVHGQALLELWKSP